jgi:hypothetical protein
MTLRCVPREQVAPERLGRLRRAPVKEPSLGHALGIRLRVSLPRRARDPLAQILHATRSRLPSTGDLSRPACACPFETPPPSSRRCRLRAGFVRSSLSRPLGALARGSVSSARRPSTSAITTVPEHDSGRDLPPRRPRRDRSLRGVSRAAALALRRAAGRSLSGPGAVVRLAAPPAPPLVRGASPRPRGSRAPPVTEPVSAPAGEPARIEGTKVPTSLPAGDASATRSRAASPPFREEGTDGRTRGAFRRAATLWGLSARTPQLVTNLWNTCGGAFSIVAISLGIDGPRECGDPIAPAPGQGRCRRDRSAPLDFCNHHGS